MINGVSITTRYIPPYSEVFVATIVYMMGDADSYVTKVIAMTEDQVIAFKNLFDHGKWTRDRGYQHGELYEALEETYRYEQETEIEELFATDHDAWGYGHFESLHILWFDREGVPHNVEFYWQ